MEDQAIKIREILRINRELHDLIDSQKKIIAHYRKTAMVTSQYLSDLQRVQEAKG